MSRKPLRDAILDYMVPGKPYAPSQFRFTFQLSTASVRFELQELAKQGRLQEQKIDNVPFWIRPDTARSTALPPMRPLTISAEMKRSLERTKELYVHPSKF